jgi:hypothetical protein
MAAAMVNGGRLWSIDIGEKESRIRPNSGSRSYDEQLEDVCARFGLNVDILVGDSRTIDLDTGEVDVVFIDGDHSYEGVRSDFQRFGMRTGIGGAVLFDDAFDERLFRTHTDTVGQLIKEIEVQGQFRLVKSIDRLAHIERINLK